MAAFGLGGDITHPDGEHVGQPGADLPGTGQAQGTDPDQGKADAAADDVAVVAVDKVGYAMRDLDALLAQAAAHGPSVGVYAERLLDVELPWTRMRTVYRLLGLALRYGSTVVDAACAKTLLVDVVDVRRIVGILEAARACHDNGGAPRGAVCSSGGGRPPPPGRRSGWVKLAAA
ncbi:MAG: hypothetical protein LC749_14870 [Actinobacteria bacterium]|nr:hypothetical protein [Actinomycetota bacterium]